MFRTYSNFEKLLDKATSPLLLDLDWTAVLQICDAVRQGDIPPGNALSYIKRKISSNNPHVALYALQVLESCVKNCGTPFHQVVATKEFMDDLKDILKKPVNEKVKAQILDLIQMWAHAFRNEPKYSIVSETQTRLRNEGHIFPPLKTSDALFIADIAPQWIDGNICNRCRVQFKLMQRKHHCRNCGHVYCQKCSSKTAAIPKYGIEKRVRVCDGCYDILQRSRPTSPTRSPSKEASLSVKSMPQLEDLSQEEEDLQLAMALSKSEQESKEQAKHQYSKVYDSAGLSFSNPELQKYLDRDYWERKVSEDSQMPPSPPTLLDEPQQIKEPIEKEDEEEQHLNHFINNFRSTLEIFVYRMTNDCRRGRPIVEDNFVQTVFLNICDLHSKLIMHITETDRQRNFYETLQEKLSQIRDERAALESLRQEHLEEKRRQAELVERQRQAQIAEKLQVLRAKKREYFEHQRQLAIRRFQEQRSINVPPPMQPNYTPYPQMGTGYGRGAPSKEPPPPYSFPFHPPDQRTPLYRPPMSTPFQPASPESTKQQELADRAYQESAPPFYYPPARPQFQPPATQRAPSPQSPSEEQQRFAYQGFPQEERRLFPQPRVSHTDARIFPQQPLALNEERTFALQRDSSPPPSTSSQPAAQAPKTEEDPLISFD